MIKLKELVEKDHRFNKEQINEGIKKGDYTEDYEDV